MGEEDHPVGHRSGGASARQLAQGGEAETLPERREQGTSAGMREVSVPCSVEDADKGFHSFTICAFWMRIMGF
jgi:hypothetical protein